MTEGTSGEAPRSPVSHDWQDWVRTNLRRVAMAAGAVALVALAAVVMISSRARKESFAARSLGQAWATVEAGNIPLAANDLSRLVERFRGTDAAREAAILLAELRLLDGQTDLAVQSLRDFLAQRHERYFQASAWALLGGGLESQGRYREAADAYRRASEAAELDFLKAQYLIDSGRAAALGGDSASARESLAEVLSRYESHQQAAEARVRLAELGGEPQVADTR